MGGCLGQVDRPIGSTAMSVVETRIMDLWDAGESIERISRATGINRAKVGVTVTFYGNLGDGWMQAMRLATREHGARLREVGGRFDAPRACA